MLAEAIATATRGAASVLGVADMDVEDVAMAVVRELLQVRGHDGWRQFIRAANRRGRLRAIDLLRVRSGRSGAERGRRVDPLRRAPLDLGKVDLVVLPDEERPDRVRVAALLIRHLTPAERRALSRYVREDAGVATPAERRAQSRALRRLRLASTALQKV